MKTVEFGSHYKNLMACPRTSCLAWKRVAGIKLRVTFKSPDVSTTLRYATCSGTRERIYAVNSGKCPQNGPLLKEVIVLRDEAARLLGYSNHAELRLQDRMHHSIDAVKSFLADMHKVLTGRGGAQLHEFRQLKETDLRSRGEVSDGHFYLWDKDYYSRILLEKLSVDQLLVAEYFSLGSTIDKMLRIFENLFGIVFENITCSNMNIGDRQWKSDSLTWHEEVQLFGVWDNNEVHGDNASFCGYLYLDLHPRSGKYGNPSNFNLRPVRENGHSLMQRKLISL